MTLRTRIKALANKKGLSLPNLEAALGFGSGTIVKWDKSTPNVAKLQEVANYFGVSIDYLVTGKETIELKKNNNSRDITEELDKLIQELENEEEPVYYEGKPVDKRTVSIMRNALEIAFENLESKKK